MKGKIMTYMPQNAVVWAEIPVRDLDKAARFYADVLQCEMRTNTSGPAPMVDIVATGVSAHLYQAAPAPRGKGPTIHLAASGAIEDALARSIAAGGVQITPIITIPPGRFAKIEDPDGNSIGLFQPA
jgi:uncharacterized protein